MAFHVFSFSSAELVGFAERHANQILALGKVVSDQLTGSTHRFLYARRGLCVVLFARNDDALDAMRDRGFQQGALRGEVFVERSGAGRQSGRLLDVGDRSGGVSPGSEELERFGEKAIPPGQPW